MYIWIIILFAMAGIVFGLDYLLRRQKWKDNSKEEKISLLVNMFSVGPYIYLSALGMLWGITLDNPESAFGKTLYDVTLIIAGLYFIVAIGAVILSFVFRKTGKTKASIWTNVIALFYIVAVLAINYLAGKML